MYEKLGYTPEEAAEVSSLGRTKMFELIRTGEIASFKEGRRRIVPADAIREYFEKKTRAATSASLAADGDHPGAAA